MPSPIRFLFALVFLLLLSSSAYSQRFELVWSDEFNQTELDTDVWNPWEGTAYNNEDQYYTPREKNLFVNDGMLYIVGHRENYGGRDWTSGRINTQNNFEFQYGKVEIRAKLPEGTGLWPAFWMLGSNIEDDRIGWPYSGEIDIMEYRGHRSSQTLGTIHFAAEEPEFPRTPSRDHRYVGAEYDLPEGSFSEDFHLFQFQWSDSLLIWSVDDVEFYRLSKDEIKERTSYYPFDQPFYLILNLAIGGDFLGSQQPDHTTPNRNEVIVDYVRVYQDLNQPPSVETEYGSRETVSPNQNITLSAEVTDKDGTVEEVEFILNGEVLASDTTSPYQTDWRPGIDGCYDFDIKAYDDYNSVGRNNTETTFDVGSGCQERPYTGVPQTFPGTLQFEFYDYGGLNISYYDSTPDTNLGNGLGNDFRFTEAVDIIPDENEEGNYLITETTIGEWTSYQLEVTQSGIYDIKLKVVGGTQSGRLDLTLDNEEFIYFTRLRAQEGENYITKTVSDVELIEGTYELKIEVAQDGSGLKLDHLEAILTETITSYEDIGSNLPTDIQLDQNYPNPFNPSTKITLNLDYARDIQLDVYNGLGQEIETLHSGILTSGNHIFTFDATGLSSGIYYYKVITQHGSSTRKMLLLR